jgi:hypothetical protein
MRTVNLPQEEACPVPDYLLGNLYRASPTSLHALIESVPAEVRAMLAIFCSRRTHLASLGLAIASTCERDELMKSGGEQGALVFAQSRQIPPLISQKRRKVTLPRSSAKGMRLFALDSELAVPDLQSKLN